MIPVIGFMIGTYIIARCAEVISCSVHDKPEGWQLVIVLSLGAVVVAAIGMFELFNLSTDLFLEAEDLMRR